MNAIDWAKSAYVQNNPSTRTAQGTEYEILAQITRRLRAASDPSAGSFKDLVDALHENRKFWVFLAVSVADSENKLPPELRARIFYLAEFTEQHSSRILTQKVDPGILIEINTSVMRGLRMQGGQT